MQTAVLATSPVRGQRFYYRLLFVAAFPFMLASECLNRMSARTDDDGRPELRMRSAVAEARESTLVAISYAVMARDALRTSARQSGKERLS